MAEVNIQVDTKLDAPDLPEGHSLYRVVEAALKSRGTFSNANGTRVFWPAEYFQLDKVSLFRNADEAERQAIVERCNRNILAESYYIEKCGMYFASKMCLLAETTQERMLYSLFNADEATHFNWIKNFISDDAAAAHLDNPFIRMLDELLQREDRTTLTFLVQILLEGWGLAHYNRLLGDCQDEHLRLVFETILKDEARHHGSGLLLFNDHHPSAAQLETIIEYLGRFYRLAQVGPQMVVSEIEYGIKDRIKDSIKDSRGPLSKEQRARIFAELECEAGTAKNLATLCSLIQATKYAQVILERLETGGFLRPFNAEQCACVV